MSGSTDLGTTDTDVKQVGGDHYQTGGVQHWDLCVDCDMHYLLACASKYVFRHRKKRGREDLEKATSYLERYEQARRNGKTTDVSRPRCTSSITLLEWAAQARIDARDLLVLHDIMCTKSIDTAIKKIRFLIDEEYPPGPPIAFEGSRNIPERPGTPADGGHHERACDEADAELGLSRDALNAACDDNMHPESLSRHDFDHKLDLRHSHHYVWDVSRCCYVLRPQYQPPANGA